MQSLDQRAREFSELDAAKHTATKNIPQDDIDSAMNAARDGLREARTEARQAERRELARELHDTVVQPLTALLISMETLSEPGRSELPQAQLDTWKALAREAVQSLRGTMAGLRTHPHAQLGLPDALRRHLMPQVASRGLQVMVQATAWPEDLPEDWTTSLYLTVREALMNVEKHAQASQCAVVLRCSARQLAITIVDDGVGFTHKRTVHAQPNAQGTGFGIGGMRDRVRTLGGRLTLTTAPGCGTRIEIAVPRVPSAQAKSAAQHATHATAPTTARATGAHAHAARAGHARSRSRQYVA